MDRQHDIDRLFSDKLYNYQTIPPPNAWNAIRKGLPQKLPFYKTPSFFIAAALTVLFMGAWVSYTAYNGLPITGNGVSPAFITHTNDKLPNGNSNTNTDPADNTASTHHTSPIQVVDDHNSIQQNSFRPEEQHTSPLMNANGSTDSGSAIDIPSVAHDKPLSQLPKSVPINYQTASDKVLVAHVPPSTSIVSQEIASIANKKPLANQEIASIANKKILANQEIISTVNKKTFNNHQLVDGAILSPYLPTTNLVAHSAEVQKTPPAVQMSEKSAVSVPAVSLLETDHTKQLQEKTVLEPIHLLPLESRKTLLSPDLMLATAPLALENRVSAVSNAIAAPQKPRRNGIGLSVQAFAMYGTSRIWSSTAENETLHTPFGSSYSAGVSLGYDFTPRFGVVAEYIAHTRQSQTIERTDNGTVTESPIHLTYTAVPVLAKVRLLGSSHFNKPSELNLLIGLQYARLQSAAINSDNINYLNLLKQDNWGFAAGIEYDHYLTRHLAATVGVRTALQMPADGAFDLQLPSNNTTNNLFIGGKVGLSYRF